VFEIGVKRSFKKQGNVMTEQEIQQKKEAEFIKLMIIVAVFVLLIVGATFGILFGLTPSEELKTWVDTATIFTGVATPILSTVSVFLLYFVWKDNRRELKATKQALIEQSDTQNFSVFKAAICEVTDSVEQILTVKVLLKRTERETVLYLENTRLYNLSQDPLTYDECIMSFKVFLEHYFETMRSKPLEQDAHTQSFKRLLISANTHPFIEKIKTIALFFNKQKNNVHLDTLEIIVFNKLSLFTWLMFVEISFHLYKQPNKGEEIEAELVFAVIAGLICRQLKDVYWIDALSDEVLLELKARKLL
jgi:heme/copper-type cytochrome/quinol oxidase subunit 2